MRNSGMQVDVLMVSNMVAAVMVKIVQMKKMTFLKFMGVQVLSLNKMLTLVLVNQRPIEKEVNFNSDGTHISTDVHSDE
jgi:hypothetical protein